MNVLMCYMFYLIRFLRWVALVRNCCYILWDNSACETCCDGYDLQPLIGAIYNIERQPLQLNVNDFIMFLTFLDCIL